jgi:hypothetical protein
MLSFMVCILYKQAILTHFRARQLVQIDSLYFLAIVPIEAGDGRICLFFLGRHQYASGE